MDDLIAFLVYSGDIEINIKVILGEVMAKIYGIELKNVNLSPGMEDWRIEADVYWGNDRIGSYKDGGYGGPAVLEFCCDVNLQGKFYHASRIYLASYPDVDVLSLYEYTTKEFIELKGSLPKVCYRDWPDNKIAIFFIERLLYLYQLEEQFITAINEGYDAIVAVRFFALKNAKAEPDRIFYTDGSIAQFEQIIASIEKRNRNFIANQYASKEDFEIK